MKEREPYYKMDEDSTPPCGMHIIKLDRTGEWAGCIIRNIKGSDEVRYSAMVRRWDLKDPNSNIALDHYDVPKDASDVAKSFAILEFGFPCGHYVQSFYSNNAADLMNAIWKATT